MGQKSKRRGSPFVLCGIHGKLVSVPGVPSNCLGLDNPDQNWNLDMFTLGQEHLDPEHGGPVFILKPPQSEDGEPA